MARLVIRGGAIAGLADMLRYVREGTIRDVAGLTPAQLDHRHDEASNSIGTLLRHVAAVEVWYQVNTFERRDFTPDENDRWLAGLETSHVALAQRDDDWLLRVEPFDDEDANANWKWFHVCEDEINHRGQIRWLRKWLPC